VAVNGSTPFPIVVAALGPQMLKATAELADGTLTWCTGPQTLTRAQWVAAIGDALGREVPFVELTHEEAIARKAARGMGEEVARWYVEGRAMLVEHPQQANRVVEEVLGRPATPFAQWARDNVDAFRAP